MNEMVLAHQRQQEANELVSPAVRDAPTSLIDDNHASSSKGMKVSQAPTAAAASSSAPLTERVKAPPAKDHVATTTVDESVSMVGVYISS